MKSYSILWLFPTLLVFAGCADQSLSQIGLILAQIRLFWIL